MGTSYSRLDYWKDKGFCPVWFPCLSLLLFLSNFSTVFKMKKFNFRKVLDGLTASSPGSGSSSNSGGVGSGSVHPGGTAGALREEIQESLTSDYFQICKVSFELALRSVRFFFHCCEETRERTCIHTHHVCIHTRWAGNGWDASTKEPGTRSIKIRH